MRALAAGWSGIKLHWRLVLLTFFIQFCIAGLASFAVWLATARLSGGSALFAKAADGDLPSLIIVLIERPSLLTVPFVLTLTALLAYAAISWFMVAGLIGAFRSQTSEASLAQFGKSGMERVFSFARLAVWSLIPYVLVVIVYSIPMIGSGSEVFQTLSMTEMAWTLFVKALPALILLWIVWTLIDIARVLLVDAEKPSAWRAIGRSFKVIVRKPSLLAITLAGHLLSALLVFLSFKLLGLSGGVGALLLRQALLLLRHAVHVGVIAAEVDRI